MKRHTTIIAVAAAVVLIVALATATPTTAASDDGLIGDLVDDEDDGRDWSATIWGTATGSAARAWGGVHGFFADESAMSDEADAVESLYNEHADEFEAYVNERATATTDVDVVRIVWDNDGESAERYLVATVSNGNYTDSEVVRSTDRGVDGTVTLDGHAARSSSDELEHLYDEYVEPGANVSDADGYVSRLASEYGGSVERVGI